ncbi:MAG: PaaI family thioesterase [Candidatus Eisenbacteria bacterium]|uniref:PaaI family thioesterase n=1 Tax=Eiseniibacteriota bacterium TaxID=2212470 RepID=A0A849SD36_UNCEI|nr:PaaI family thioesterase [Candidatus Eisenbacteria bacterium]
MADFKAGDADFERRVRESFARQKVMTLFGAELTVVEPGRVTIELNYRDDLVQQHGYMHAGVLGTIADSAGGYAGYTLMPAGSSVLSTEYRVHLLAPGRGERFAATGRVIRAGRTLTVCELEVEAIEGEKRTRCVWGSQTLMCLRERSDMPPG